MKTITVNTNGKALKIDVKTLSVMIEPTTSPQWQKFGKTKYTVVITGSKHLSVVNKLARLIDRFIKGFIKGYEGASK